MFTFQTNDGTVVLPISTKIDQVTLHASIVVFHCSTECQGFTEGLLQERKQGSEGPQGEASLPPPQPWFLLYLLYQRYGFSLEEGSGSLKNLKTTILEDAQVIRIVKSACRVPHPREAAMCVSVFWVSRVKYFPFSTVNSSYPSELQEEPATLSASTA